MGLGLPYAQYPAADNRLNRRKLIPSGTNIPLIAAGICGDDIGLTARNLGTRADIPVAGAPIINAQGAIFKAGANFLEAAIDEVETFSFFAMIKCGDTAADNAHVPNIMGNFANSVDPGVLFYWNAADTLRLQAAQVNTPNPTIRNCTLVVANPTTWRIVAAYFNGATSIVLYDITGGTNATQTITAARDYGNLPIRVGSARSSSYAGLQPMQNWMMFAGLPTAAERTKIAAQMAKIGAAYGAIIGAT